MMRRLTELEAENAALRERLREAESTLAAIRRGEADALVVSEPHGTRVYTLRGAERPYRLLVESMPDGAVVLADDGALLFSNRHFAELVREPVEVLVHRSFAEYLPAEARSGFEELLRAGDGDVDLELRAADGSERLVRLSMRALRLGDTPARCAIVADLSVRQRAAVELGRARATQAILEQAPDAMLVCDADGRITQANHAAQRLCDSAPVGTAVWRCLAGEAGARLESLVRAALAGNRPPATRIATAEGDRHLQLTCGPLHDGPSVIGAVVSLTDVTAQQSVEQALRESEERMRLALASVDFGTFDWSIREGRVRWAPETERIWGVEPGRFEGTLDGWNRRVHPDDVATCVALAEQAFATGIYESRHRIVWPDGSIRWLYSRGQVLYDDAGPYRMVGIHQDITERRAAEQALRESERRFRKLANQLPAIVWRSNAAGDISFVNQAWFRYTGLSLPETLEKGWLPALDASEVEQMAEIWQRARAAGQPYEGELRIRSASGEMRCHMVRVVPERDVEGQVTGWIGTASDVESMKQMQEQLTEADRRKDEFLAMLAHELRNPLAPIRHCVEVLRAVNSADPPVARARDIIDRQVEHMARLLDDLLDMSRITRGQIVLRTELLPLGEVVEAAIEAARPQLEAARHQLDVALPDEPVVVDGDKARLVQAVTNLLSNAVKFTPPGGHIAVSVEANGREATVSIRDDGLGIPPEQQERIFEAFAQGDTDLARSKGGLGIGLALVRRLLDLHGGAVRVESDGAGRGSLFTLAVPLARRSGPLRARAPGARPATDSALRVLVVEDHADAAEALQLHLRLRGHETRVARDGIAALEALEAFAPHVAFVDVGLPGIDGFEVARRMRSHPNGAGAVLVALTGYGRSEDKQKASEAGFDAHLTKPAPLTALTQVLAEAAAMQRRTRSEAR